MALGSSVSVGEEHPGHGAGVLGKVHTTGLSSHPCLRVPWLWGRKGWSLSPRSFLGCDTAEPTCATGAGGLGCSSEGFEPPVYFIHIQVTFKADC